MTDTFTNLDEWRAKKRWSDKLEEHTDQGPSQKGFIYPDGAWIELTKDGGWHTIASNAECSDFNLRDVEEWLWYAHSCSYAQTQRDRLCEELQTYCVKHKLPQLSADKLVVHLMEIVEEKEQEAKLYRMHQEWAEDFVTRWDRLED